MSEVAKSNESLRDWLGLYRFDAELDTGDCDESNAWRLLRAHERDT